MKYKFVTYFCIIYLKYCAKINNIKETLLPFNISSLEIHFLYDKN